MSYAFRVVHRPRGNLFVIDGDTFVADIIVTIPELGVDIAIRNRRVRLFGIDTPEPSEPGGPEATAFTCAWLAGHAERARLDAHGLDSPYKRLLGDVVTPEGRTLVADLRAAGHTKPAYYRVVESATIAAGLPIYRQVRR